jgi:tight adherence protein B
MIDLLNGPMFFVVALAFCGVIFCTMLAFSDGSGGALAKRATRVAARTRGEAPVAALSLRRAADGGLDTLIRRFLPRPELLRERLRRTGKSISIGKYAIFCLIVAILAIVANLSLGLGLAKAIPAGIVTGILFPHIIIGKLIQRRIYRFEALFPEAIGLIVRGLRSGLPATESMQVVGREIGDPVGEEFRRISDDVRLGMPLEEALWNTAKRIGTPEFNFLVVTMIVQRETGGNLAETLENLDNVLRRRRQMRLKIKAMSSEARASAMIIGSLPFVMFGIMFVVNNAYIMQLVNTHAGNMLLLGAACSMITGIGVMRKLIRFEI